MQKIVPFLWFNNNAEEAAEFYVEVFSRGAGSGSAGKNSKIINANKMSVVFELEGQKFYALNGGPQFPFTEAISLFVDCRSQEEVDELWEKLLAGGGKPSRCGWLKDKFGLSWQIIPTELGRMLNDKDPIKAKRVMDAMLKMSKIDIKLLEEAYHQK